MEDIPHYSKPIHAIVMPVPLQGHVIPAVHLALKLASNGFTITFINAEIVHHQITTSLPNNDGKESDIFSGARESGLDIRHRTVNDGFPLSFDRMAHQEEYLEKGILGDLPILMDELVGEIVKEAAGDVPVSCLVTDTFYRWPSTLAEKYDLVYVSFWTEPALVFTLYYHVHLLKSNHHFASHGHDNRKDTIDYIPGVKAIKPKDLPSYLQETDASTVMHRLIDEAFKDVKRADFILCNTVEELESEPILALQEGQPFYAIGPLFPSGFTKSIVPTSLRAESNCSQWLNTKPHGSVLYVSFGSFITSSKRDIDEIALGLALSKVNFIWVLRHDAMSYEEPYVLPTGFEEEVEDRGLIVTWTNQIEVISHKSIGGFITHCGWNSILESIWCGVPMLCFPLITDQITNRKLLVDDWKIGRNLCDWKSLTRSEVAVKINQLMCRISSAELRIETTKVRQTLESALASNGSSKKNFSQFIGKVQAKISKRI